MQSIRSLIPVSGLTALVSCGMFFNPAERLSTELYRLLEEVNRP